MIFILLNKRVHIVHNSYLLHINGISIWALEMFYNIYSVVSLWDFSPPSQASLLPEFLLLWYSRSVSLWRSFTSMLLDRPSLGEGGVSARVLTALFGDCITTSPNAVQSEQARRALSI